MKNLNITHAFTVTDETITEYPLPFNFGDMVLQNTQVNDIEREGFSFSGGVLTAPPLVVGDKVKLIFDPAGNSFLHIVKQYGHSLFKQYASDQRLRNNSTYHIEGSIGGWKFEKEFKTYYDPFYTKVEQVRKITGDLLSEVPDDLIMEEIHLVSKDAQEIYEENNGDIGETLPRFFPNYVLYKTAHTFAYAAYLSITGKIGSVDRRLSKMAVSKQINLPYVDDMLGRLERRLKPLEDAVQGSKARPKAFVKAGNTATYPLNVRGGSF